MAPTLVFCPPSKLDDDPRDKIPKEMESDMMWSVVKQGHKGGEGVQMSKEHRAFGGQMELLPLGLFDPTAEKIEWILNQFKRSQQ